MPDLHVQRRGLVAILVVIVSACGASKENSVLEKIQRSHDWQEVHYETNILMTTVNALENYVAYVATPQNIEGRIYVASAKFNPLPKEFFLFHNARFYSWRFPAPRTKVVINAEYRVFVNTGSMPVVLHPPNLQKFVDPLQAEGGIDLDDDRVVQMAESIKNMNFEEQINAIIDYTTAHIKYKPYKIEDDRSWLVMGSREVLDLGYGHEGQMCVVFIAISRSAGIPAVFVNGVVSNPRQFAENRNWVEVKRPDGQWMVVDVSLEYMIRQNNHDYNRNLLYIPYYWTAQTPLAFNYSELSVVFSGGRGSLLFSTKLLESAKGKKKKLR